MNLDEQIMSETEKLVIDGAIIGTILDFDHGEGWVTFSWIDSDEIDRSLKIDLAGFCSREMPIRSGRGIRSIDVATESVRLRLTQELAEKLQLAPETIFMTDLSDDLRSDLDRLNDQLPIA